jgi:hypothetical protein
MLNIVFFCVFLNNRLFGWRKLPIVVEYHQVWQFVRDSPQTINYNEVVLKTKLIVCQYINYQIKRLQENNDEEIKLTK